MYKYVLLLLLLATQSSPSIFFISASNTSTDTSKSLNATSVIQGVSAWLSGVLSTMDSTLQNYTVVKQMERNVDDLLRHNLTLLYVLFLYLNVFLRKIYHLLHMRETTGYFCLVICT